MDFQLIIFDVDRHRVDVQAYPNIVERSSIDELLVDIDQSVDYVWTHLTRRSPVLIIV
jgi:hypothetical protein